MINRRDLDELKNFKANNPIHPNLDQLNGLIRELTPIEYPDRFRTLPLDNLLREALQPRNNYIKDSFQTELILDIDRAMAVVLTNNREKRNWKSFDNKNTWGKIVQLIGDKMARNLYDTLI